MADVTADRLAVVVDDCDCGPGEHTLACDARFGARVRMSLQEWLAGLGVGR